MSFTAETARAAVAARLAKVPASRRSEVARLAANARWAKHHHRKALLLGYLDTIQEALLEVGYVGTFAQRNLDNLRNVLSGLDL